MVPNNKTLVGGQAEDLQLRPEDSPDGVIPQKIVIGPGNLITIGNMILIVGAAIYGDRRLNSIEHQIEAAAVEVRHQTAHLEDTMKSWIQVLRAANPALVVPEFPR